MALFFIVGLLYSFFIGSFLNCVIYRLEVGQSFVWGRSYCPHCKHSLGSLELVPVLSFLGQLGRCKHCHKAISFSYPLVEIATSLAFLGVFYLLGGFTAQATLNYFVSFLLLFYIFCSLIVIFVYDLRHFLIPDKVLFPAIISALLLRLFQGAGIGYLVAIVVAAGFFLAIFLVSKGKWIGFGDVKLAILLGLLLGFPNILAGLFIAFVSGAIISLIAISLKKKGLKSELPFAPFLILGTVIALFWGPQLINWYMGLLAFNV